MFSINAWRRTWIQSLGLLLLLSLAVVLRVWGISFGVPERVHVNEPAYVLAALELGSGDWQIEYPLLSPNLYEMVLAFAYGLLYALLWVAGIYSSTSEFGRSYLTDPTPFYLLARLISTLFSTLTLLVTYLAGRRLIGSAGAFMGALVLAVAFIDVRHAHFAEPYALVGLLAATSSLLAFSFLESRKTFYLLLSSFVAGGAFALRLSLAPLLMTPCLAALGVIEKDAALRVKLGSVLRSGTLVLIAAGFGFVCAYPGILLRPMETVEVFGFYSGLARGDRGFGGFNFNESSGWLFYLRVFLLGLGAPILVLVVTGLFVGVRRTGQRKQCLVGSRGVAGPRTATR